jgi:hypothetical protein
LDEAETNLKDTQITAVFAVNEMAQATVNCASTR